MENGRDEEQLLLWDKKRREILDALVGLSDEGAIEDRETEVRRIYNEVQQINEIYEDVAELLQYEHSRSIDEVGKSIEAGAAATAVGKLQLLDATRRKHSTLFRRCCWASIIFVTLMLLLTIVLLIMHYTVR